MDRVHPGARDGGNAQDLAMIQLCREGASELAATPLQQSMLCPATNNTWGRSPVVEDIDIGSISAEKRACRFWDWDLDRDVRSAMCLEQVSWRSFCTRCCMPEWYVSWNHECACALTVTSGPGM